MPSRLDRRDALKAGLLTSLSGVSLPAAGGVVPVRRTLATLDMVHPNPGEAPPATAYLDPAFLKSRGYGGVVIEQGVEGITTLSAFDSEPVPAEEARLAARRRAEIGARIAAAKREGLTVHAWVQYLVLPKRLLARRGSELVDAAGRIDLRRPATQAATRAFTREILAAFPDLDGLVVRTGEIYLHDLPYHAARLPDGAGDGLIAATTAMTQGEQSHLTLLAALRETVCVEADKDLIYRTWDFGDNFHNNPRYYLDVTDQVAPHPKLAFSIKFQRGDFHRATPRSTHARRAGAVTDRSWRRSARWRPMARAPTPITSPRAIWLGGVWMAHAVARPAVLRDLAADPRFSGLWTWSRGGGWDGPRIQDELWCDLNAYVLAGFARDTTRDEASLFDDYGRDVLNLSATDSARLREVCRLSSAAVLRGQLTDLGAEIDLWWARDDTLSEPRLGDFVDKGLVEAAIAEKHAATAMWRHIAEIMPTIRFADPRRQAFAEVSARYGHYKYAIIAAGWTAALLVEAGARDGGVFQVDRIRAALADYERLWTQWRRLAADQPLCPTLPRPVARGGGPGLDAAMARWRARFG